MKLEDYGEWTEYYVSNNRFIMLPNPKCIAGNLHRHDLVKLGIKDIFRICWIYNGTKVREMEYTFQESLSYDSWK